MFKYSEADVHTYNLQEISRAVVLFYFAPHPDPINGGKRQTHYTILDRTHSVLPTEICMLLLKITTKHVCLISSTIFFLRSNY